MFCESSAAEELYNPLRMGLQFVANHPAGYCLAVQKDYLGILNYQDYELLSGFHLEESIAGKERHVWTSGLSSHFKILVKKGIKGIEIPVRCPAEILSRGKYDIVISGPEAGICKFTLTQPSNSCRIYFDEMVNSDRVLELMIEIPFTWKPCECMNSTDQRSLGIDIVLSEINMF